MSKQIRDYQNKSHEASFASHDKGIIKQLNVMATGCHAKGTKILMYNGFSELVENIVPGDKIMGDDSTPREVLQLARGREKMYKIIPVKGESFEVNENHILSLKRTGVPIRKQTLYPKIVNVTVKDYLEWDKTKKHIYKLYRVPVEFSNIGSETHPYWIGLWLGDGTVDRPAITNPEPEIEAWLLGEFNEFRSWNHPEITIKRREPKDRCVYYDFTIPDYEQNQHLKNSLLKVIRDLYVDGEKRIYSRLLRGDRKSRLDILAGLLDSDGHYSNGIYEIITKYSGLRDDILFLARSLGFAAYSSKKIGTIKSIDFTGEYWRIVISGELSVIPCKVNRKKATVREQPKNVLVSGFSVEELEENDFYGFALDGNHLYCMGDFTVTHNTGKTYAEVKLNERYEAEKGYKKTLWITHTEELLEQSALAFLSEKFNSEYSKRVENMGFLNYAQGGMFMPPQNGKHFRMGAIKADVFQPHGDVVMASAQTLHRRLDRLKPDAFDYIVCDEAHLFGAPTFVKPLHYFQPKLLRGLTATPWRTDGMLLGNIFDEITYQYDIGEAIRDKNLCELDAVRIKTTTSLDGVKTTAGELNQKDLASEINTPQRNQLIAASYIKYANGRQFIAFCVDIQHAMDLADAFRANGITCSTVSGDEEITPNRSQTIKDFKGGAYSGLTNCMVLTAGFDHPNVGCVIMACPTKSKTKYLQCVGRGTRLKDGNFVDRFGQNCIILDVVDSTSRHQLVNAWELDRDKVPQERVFTTQEKKDKLIAEREKLSRKLDFKREKDERVDLLSLPKPKVNKSIRMSTTPASQKQLEAIAKWGYNTTQETYTMDMIQDIFMQQSASEKQIWALKKAGYDVSRGVTIVEANMAFKEIENRKLQSQNSILLSQLPFIDL